MTPAIAFLFVLGVIYAAVQMTGGLSRVPDVLVLVGLAGSIALALLVANQASTRSAAAGAFRNANGFVIEGGTGFVVAMVLWLPFSAIIGAFVNHPLTASLGVPPVLVVLAIIGVPMMALLFWAYPRITAWFARTTKGLRRLFRFAMFGQGGSAQFAGFLEDWANPFRPGSLLLGSSLFSAYGRKVGLDDDRGFLTIASSRTGKGRSAIIPNLLTWPGSALVIDPKGTNAAVTAARRGFGGGRVTSFLGQEVYVVDPFGIVPGAERAKYNPLRMIDPESDTVAEDIMLIADALVVPDTDGDSHWSEGAKQILAGLIAHLVTTDARHEATLTDLREIVNMDAESLDAIFEAMGSNMEGAGLAAGAAALVLNAGPNERGSLMTTVLRNTAWLDSEAMRGALGWFPSDFDLRDLKRKAMTVYVVLPPHLLEDHKRFMRLFVNLAVRAMSVGPKPKYPVLFLLDEFFSLGKLAIMEKAAGLLSGYGLKLWPVVQNIGQLKELYPKNWLTFLANSGAIQVFGVNDRETAHEIVQVLGQMAKSVKVGNHVNRVIANLREGPEVGMDAARETGRQIILRSGDDPMLLGRIDYDKAFPTHWYNPDPDHDRAGGMQRLLARLNDTKERAQLLYLSAASWLAGVTGRNTRQVELQREEKSRRERLADPDDWASMQHFHARNRDHREKDSELKRIGEARARMAKKAGPKPKAPPRRSPQRRQAADKPRKGGALEELGSLIGLEAVKKQVQGVMAEIRRDEARRKHGLPVTPVSRHLVFTGNPGTGKTTVARIVGAAYRDMGLLKKGHLVEVSRKDLAGENWGSGTKMTGEVIKRALDGVLFVDEAYSLHLGHTNQHGDPLGEEVITTLLAAMENHRDRLIVIAAGYADEMHRFIDSNPGLASRFKTFIDFPDYDATAMAAIFDLMAGQAGYVLTDEAKIKVGALLGHIEAGKGKGFGNGRAVRNVLEQSLSRQAERLAAVTEPTKDDLTRLTEDDIPDTSEEKGRGRPGNGGGTEGAEVPAGKRSTSMVSEQEPDYDAMDIFALADAVEALSEEQAERYAREDAAVLALEVECARRVAAEPENRLAIEKEYAKKQIALLEEQRRESEAFERKSDRIKRAMASREPDSGAAEGAERGQL